MVFSAQCTWVTRVGTVGTTVYLVPYLDTVRSLRSAPWFSALIWALSLAVTSLHALKRRALVACSLDFPEAVRVQMLASVACQQPLAGLSSSRVSLGRAAFDQAPSERRQVSG